MLIPALAMLALVAYAEPEALVSTEWLSAHLNDPDVRIVDMRRAAGDYDQGHLPNAVFLANDDIRRPKNP